MYRDYAYLDTDHLAFFGGYWGNADDAGAFSLRVSISSTEASTFMGSRLIKFGD